MDKLRLFLLSILIPFVANSQDTVRYLDTNYLFLPYGGAVAYDFSSSGGTEESAPYFWGKEYYANEPTTLYGIAITMNPLPKNVSLYAVLMQREGGHLMWVDTVMWHDRNPDRHFAYRMAPDSLLSINCDSSLATDSICGLYEFYFDNPHSVIDTYYVGIRYFDPSHPDEVYYNTLRNKIVRSVPCDHDSDLPVPQWIFVYYSFLPGVGFTEERFDGAWGAFFPIVTPLDTDAVNCPVVSNFALAGQQGSEAWFTWDTVGEQTDFQVSVACPGCDPDSGRLTRPYQSPHYVSGLDPDSAYAVSIRAKCHHSCFVHDTLLWGPWSDPIIVTAAADGIAQPSPDRPALTLHPNPAHDRVTVSWGQPYPTATLTVTDAQGRELLRQDVSGRDSFQLSTLLLSQSKGNSQLPAGIHLVTLTTPEGTLVQKLVVE